MIMKLSTWYEKKKENENSKRNRRTVHCTSKKILKVNKEKVFSSNEISTVKNLIRSIR